MQSRQFSIQTLHQQYQWFDLEKRKPTKYYR